MRRSTILTVGLTAAAIAVGLIGWSGHVPLLPFACGFPLLWARAPTRSAVALVSAGYFLAASRSLPQGVATFFATDIWPGLLLWFAASASFVIVHVLCWSDQPGRGMARRYLTASTLIAMPPFGITGWAHPLTAAGMLFPGWGWWGLAAMTAGLMGLVTRMRPAAVVALGGFWLWSAISWTEPELPQGWRGVDLDMGASLGREDGLQQHRDLIATVRRSGDELARTVVLPESAVGLWTPTVERLWQEALRDTELVVLAGAMVIDGVGYDNVVVTISGRKSVVLYRERMPVPISMWQPWRRWFGASGGVEAHVFANPVVETVGRRVAILICYEQLLVWPVLHSMLHDPDMLVAIGNGWWTLGTSTVAIQRATVAAWARLFDKPVVFSFNL